MSNEKEDKENMTREDFVKKIRELRHHELEECEEWLKTRSSDHEFIEHYAMLQAYKRVLEIAEELE